MKKKQLLILLILLVAVAALGGCEKGSNDPDDKKEGVLVEVKSYYQTYSYGNLNSFKSEWEYWKYNTNNQITESKTYLNYEHEDRLLIPYVNIFYYNSDGTLRENKKSSLTSTSIYRFEYNDNKQLIKEEFWLSSGLISTDTYTYNNGRVSEKKGSSIIVYDYDDNGNILSEEYFKDEKREPWFKYVYERDHKGNETKKTQFNLDKDNIVILNQANYEYNSSGLISKKTFRKGVLGADYIVSYTYNEKGQIYSEQIKRKNLSGFQDWMLITYEYIYK